MVQKYLSSGEQTTINSTITELFPALAFNVNKKPYGINNMYSFVDDIWKKELLVTGKYSKTFAIKNDIKSAYTFIHLMDRIRPSMLDTKLSNAVGILKYLYDLDSKKSISKVVWGYRGKPTGVPDNHAGDIFVFFTKGSPKVLGISLKAGTAKSSEPKMNSYVRTTITKPMWKTADIKSERRLADKLWLNVYSKLPGLSKKINKTNWINLIGKNQRPDVAVIDAVLRQFKKSEKQFDKLYQEMNLICRKHIIQMINRANVKVVKDWIKDEFNLETQGKGKPGEVPLILVKAVGMKAEEQGDKLARMFPKITKFNARLDNSSVQEWFIDVYSGSEKLTLLMTIRSDSKYRESKQKGKLGAFMMLKLLYRGYK